MPSKLTVDYRCVKLLKKYLGSYRISKPKTNYWMRNLKNLIVVIYHLMNTFLCQGLF